MPILMIALWQSNFMSFELAQQSRPSISEKRSITNTYRDGVEAREGLVALGRE